MQEAFENNIKQQLKDFELLPNEAVWQEVELALHAKKRRIVPIWWFGMCGLFLMLIFLGYNHFYSNTSSVKKIVTSSSTQKSLPKNTHTQPTTKNELVLLEKLNAIKQSDSNTLATTAATTSIKEPTPKKSFVKTKTDTYINGLSNKINNRLNVTSQKMTQINSNNYLIKEADKVFENAELSPIALHIQTGVNFKNKNLLQTSMVKMQTYSKQDSSETASESKKNDKKVKPKKWFITGSFGLLTTKQNKLLDNLSAQANQLSFNNSTVTASASSSNTLNYPNGFARMLGLGFQQKLNNRWNYNAALQYKLLSARSLYPDSLSFGKNVDASHWIEIPINIQYKLNPTSANPFYLTAGISGAYAFARSWSIPNVAGNSFYYDERKNRKLFLNAQIGTAYSFNDNLNLHFFIEKSLTPVHKNVPNKFYFTQFNLQFFKFINTKKNKL